MKYTTLIVNFSDMDNIVVSTKELKEPFSEFDYDGLEKEERKKQKTNKILVTDPVTSRYVALNLYGNEKYIDLVAEDDDLNFVEKAFKRELRYCENPFIVDTKTKKISFKTAPNLKNKNKVSSAKEALEFISNYMAMNFNGLDKKQLKSLKEVADKWSIPFDPNLMISFHKSFNDFQPQWNSSSAYC